MHQVLTGYRLSHKIETSGILRHNASLSYLGGKANLARVWWLLFDLKNVKTALWPCSATREWTTGTIGIPTKNQVRLAMCWPTG
jgi:hypothetical protein